MFIGRANELKTLERLYSSDKFEFVVIYGRRRIGKTALINHFVKDKRCIYFTGVESNEKQNLDNFSKAVFDYSGMEAGAVFTSFQNALENLFKLSLNEKLILIIDEYPYVARSSAGFASTLQMLIDEYKDSSKMKLILCGSSMSYMVDNVLAYKAPLYGRRTAQMKIQPFTFSEASEYFSDMAPVDKALMYGIAGGTPQYILQMNSKLSVRENIINTFFEPSSFLFEEPVNLLKQEVREPALYTAIITAVASGASRLSEISSKVGENTNVCSTYIKNLIGLEIIEKETPYGEKESKRSIYKITDNMFRFWYRFVLPNNSLISRGAGDMVYSRIEPMLSDHMGAVFEDMCKQYLWSQLLQGKSPVEFNSLGRWWGNDPVEKCQTEIDIMGEGLRDKNTALFAECKWKNELTTHDVLELLIKRSRLFKYTDVHYVLFSKSGFTDKCRETAEKLGKVQLVSYEDMV